MSVKLGCGLWLGLALLQPGTAQPCRSADCVQTFPADSGAVNVRDFGAVGDGRHDDTAALLAAIAASGGDAGHEVWHDRIIYLPDGDYRVSGTLTKRYADGRFASGMILVGQSAEHTVIHLIDQAPGFLDRTAPRPVVMTSSKRIDMTGGRDYAGRGEGNDAYENFVENLTIDVGSGNPGAVGIDYLANNIGAVRDVVVRAAPGSGATGIAMLRKWPGPALLQRVLVQGFGVGIDVANTEYGLTLSQIRLSGQRGAGLRNAGNAIAAEDLVADTAGDPAIVNSDAGGLIVLAGAALSAGAGPPVDNKGTLVFRDVAIGGHPPASFTQYGAEQRQSASSAWNLLHDVAPTVPPGAWAHADLPAERKDATATLQAALGSGASTVYMPHGTYWISDSLEVPASVHKILGMNSTVRVLPRRMPGFAREAGMLRVREPGQPLSIERLAFDNTDSGPQVAVELSGPRTVVLKDVFGAGVTTLDRHPDGGRVFLEDVCCGLIKVAGKMPVVARQIDSEGGLARIRNEGAPLSIIGLKTEGFCTAVETSAHGRTEVLGGLLYVVGQPSGPDMPAFVTKDAELSASFVEEQRIPSSHYQLYLSDQRNGELRETSRESMPQRGLGRTIPLLQSSKKP